jgi:hypothetical protein
MITTLRQAYNAAYKAEQYARIQDSIEDTFAYPCKFRLSETPVFVPNAFKNQLIEACENIFDTILQPDFLEKTKGSITIDVPNETPHTHFMQVDFGVCEVDGEIIPQLIEIQGFPSLYGFQVGLAEAYRGTGLIPENMSTMFNDSDKAQYISILRDVIIKNHDPKHVILLEVEPEKQGTSIDFYATAQYLDIKILCLTQLKKNGRKLFYLNEAGEEVAVHRIYNRVIFDELDRRPDLKPEFQFTDDVDVEWAGHPNWFFRISKYSLPLFKSKYVPDSYFLHELKTIPSDLENYVLKPLFSFAGQGVVINVTQADIDAVEDKSNFILQRKVNYIPIIETPTGPAKTEIRMMVVWRDGDARPTIVNNICRMSKGEMVGVRYNMDKTWVGGTVCFFE